MENSTLNSSRKGFSWWDRTLIVRGLETVQDMIIISLCIGLFCVMVFQLQVMFFSFSPSLDFHHVTADILFVLILVELFRLMIIYLQEHRVSIGVAVEVSIVSVLREVVFHGVLEISWVQILSTGAFLLVLGSLLLVRVWLPPTFEGIDPERRITSRNKALFKEDPWSERQSFDESTSHSQLNGHGSGGEAVTRHNI